MSRAQGVAEEGQGRTSRAQGTAEEGQGRTSRGQGTVEEGQGRTSRGHVSQTEGSERAHPELEQKPGKVLGSAHGGPAGTRLGFRGAAEGGRVGAHTR